MMAKATGENEVTLSYSLKALDLAHAQAAQDLLAVLKQESDTFQLADELARQQSESIDEDEMAAEADLPAKTWLVWAEAETKADTEDNPAVSYPVGIGSIAAGELGIAILSDYQNQGLGRSTIEAMVDWSEKVGYDRLWLDVDVKNQVARHLYDELGFAIVAGAEQSVKLPTGRTATLERRELSLL
ncbi:GNAT family N-acetyltransferase [Fructobacillus papyrifericola]|uniref:GNAT family N-acetyltransferase n=1 Tax=Fructobacillus papyrifericola TaxID=2713172 RepID=A0ABS5QSS5_9LACO|nr:GNAT family N-acetyltransferase [Fructobacillus papyrifericola]MBS9336243.1 GNAT family N-acetyltransferase [Fructobacillus papyrifericola]